MLQPRQVRSTAYHVGILVLILFAGAAATACELPLDPFVVALPDKDANGGSIAAFEDWVQVPATDNADGWAGFLTVSAGRTAPQVTWTMYWSPTKGGSDPRQMGILANVPPEFRSLAKNFEIRKGFGQVPLFSLATLDLVLRSGVATMKISEVYNRNPTGTVVPKYGQGGWAGNKYRVDAPWVIPFDPTDPNKNKVKTVVGTNANGEPIEGYFVPDLQVQEMNGVEMVAAGPNCSPQRRPTDADKDAYLVALFGVDGMTPAKGPVFPATAPNTPTRWRVVSSPPPQWSSDGGVWNYEGLECDWEFNKKNTVYNPDAPPSGVGNGVNKRHAVNDAQIADFKFITPSEPFFYFVKPKALLHMRLTMSAGQYYQWEEEEVYTNAAGTVDGEAVPTTSRRTFRMTAGGPIAKGGGNIEGGVATLVRARDTSPPVHSHAAIEEAFVAKAGRKVESGKAKIVVVDDNPYFFYTKDIDPGLKPNSSLAKYNRDNMKAEFWFSTQVEDYYKSNLSELATPPPSDMPVTDTAGAVADSALFPLNQERFVWFKKTGDLDYTRAKPLGSYTKDSASLNNKDATITSPFGANAASHDAAPAYSAVEYEITKDDFDKALGVHHIFDSGGKKSEQQDFSAGGQSIAYADWKNRPKFFLRPRDPCDNQAPLGTNQPAANAAKKDMADLTGSILDEDGQEVKALAPLTPYTFKNAVTAALGGGATCACNADALGTMAAIQTVNDEVRPALVLLVKDTKYNRTYVVNDRTQGWWARAEAQEAVRTGTKATTDNETLDGPLNADGEELTFSAGGDNANQMADQLKDTPRWDPFDLTNPAAPVRRGIWVDEDTNVIFKPLAWDNLNPRTLLSSYTWSIDDQASSVTVDQAQLPANTQGQFTYVFRDPNYEGGPITKPVTLTLTVTDNSSATAKTRTMKLSFFVRSEKYKLETIEESVKKRN